jgi:hypothetical protein
MALAGGLQVAHPRTCPAQLPQKGASVTTGDNRGDNRAAVLRRQPARIVDGQLQGSYANSFEITCPDCGDDPGTDYREISAELRRVRGPYPIADGIIAYEEHLGLYHEPARATSVARGRMLADRR